MRPDGEITLGQVGLTARPLINRYLRLLVGALVLLTAWLFVEDEPGTLAFSLVAVGSLYPLFLWRRATAPGVPLTAIMGLQALVIYGTPLAVTNPGVFVYPSSEVLQAAVEVSVFGFFLGIGWLLVVRNARLRPARFCWRFEFLKDGAPRHSAVLPLLLLGAGTLFLAVNMLQLLGGLPSGVFSIARTLFDASSIAGGVLGGYFIARRHFNFTGKAAYVALFVLHCIFTTSNYTLFPASALFIALVAGLFIGGGRVPFLAASLLVAAFAFLNLSKFEMRETYWEPGQAYAYQTIDQLPERYSEWLTRSWEILTDAEVSRFGRETRTEQTLSKRINNLDNILVAQDGFLHRGLAPVQGETYAVIPLLMIPRVFWPDKPRTHEGMVLLNVYFGRQTREESFLTYISWGILPESYANFGPWLGAILCGLALGAATAWLELWSRPYPVTSLQAVLFMLLVVQCGTSFESVASVWLTSIFQMLVAVVAGACLFVRRVPLRNPALAP